MPCARIPSSLVIRNRIGATGSSRRVVRDGAADEGRMSPALSRRLIRREQSHELLQIVLERIERLHGERGARDSFKLSSLAVLIDLLARSLDGVLLRVQQ